MLKINKTPEFTHTVKVQIPVDGGHKEASFKARFRALPSSEARELQLSTEDGTTELLRRIFIGWEGLADDDDAPLLFSDAARDELCDLHFFRRAVLETYWQALNGAKRGN